MRPTPAPSAQMSFAAPQEAYAANEVVHVDATFVLYNTWEGISRQSLAALGPGD